MNAKLQDYTITARAPGKIILAGEHAVVYGKPALAMAVNRFVTTSISQHADKDIRFQVLTDKFSRTLQDLRILKRETTERYQNYLRGKYLINDVLRDPLELIQYAFIYLIDELAVTLKNGWQITIDSTLPIGCGMGTSAAVILSLLHVLVNCCGSLLPVDKYLYFGQEIENLAHGKSSGLDLFLALYGGCYLFSNGDVKRRSMTRIPLVLVNTGRPRTSTGECVAAIAERFQCNDIADNFTKVTMAMDIALQQGDLSAVQQCVRKNHKLLQDIGVVPSRVARFIAEVEKLGGAAKVSGAGTISGDHAGIVLVLGTAPILDIVQKYGYETLSIAGEFGGVQIV